jgi:hypothetical protein
MSGQELQSHDVFMYCQQGMCGAGRYSTGHSIVSQHSMEPEGSVPHSQEPPTGPYSDPEQFSPHHLTLSLQDPS